MSRILVIGPFDSTGYGIASTNVALALDAAGAEVVCRRLVLDTRQYQQPPRLQKLLHKHHLNQYDACVQVLLPHQMRPHAGLPTYGYFFWETSHFRHSSWARHLNRLQGVIVPAENTRAACLLSGVTTPIAVVPLPHQIERFERSYSPLPALKKLRSQSFVFYTIGEFIERKNLRDAMIAFYGEFSRSENVHFVVKTGTPGVSEEEFEQRFAQWNLKLLQGMKLHNNTDRYSPVTLVNHRMTDEEILRLHASCDCFVSASRGEGWSIPAMDAMALGKTPIVPKHTGYLAWADDSVGWMVDSSPVPVQGAISTFADLYRHDEDWWQPDVRGLKRAMRAAYTDHLARQTKAKAGFARAYRFAYEEVGPRLLGVLVGAKKATMD